MKIDGCGVTPALEALVGRLVAQPAVAGLVLGGSHAAGQGTPWSDLDLLLVLAGPELPFTHVTTTIGGTLTEIVTCTSDDLRAVMHGGAPAHWDVATFIRFLGGRILVDRAGMLAGAARWAAAQPPPGPDEDPWGQWRHAQYNVRQTRRYLASGDADARTAVVARMLYQLHDVLRDYFTLRNMAWPGDKDALRYWRHHEPALRVAWLAAVAENDLDRQVARWEALFPTVYARFGGMAAPDVDLLQPAIGTKIEEAVVAWKKLVR